MNEDLTDLAALKAGDPDAWERAFRRLWPIALGLARMTGLSPEDAEDAASDTMAALVKEIHLVNDDMHLVRIVCAVAKWRAIDIHRRAHRKKQDAGATVSIEALKEVMGGDFDPPSPDSPPGTEGSDDDAVRLFELVGHLPQLWRTLVMGRYLLDKKTKELAAETGLKEGAVRLYIHRALNQIREWWQEPPL